MYNTNMNNLNNEVHLITFTSLRSGPLSTSQINLEICLNYNV